MLGRSRVFRGTRYQCCMVEIDNRSSNNNSAILACVPQTYNTCTYFINIVLGISINRCAFILGEINLKSCNYIMNQPFSYCADVHNVYSSFGDATQLHCKHEYTIKQKYCLSDQAMVEVRMNKIKLITNLPLPMNCQKIFIWISIYHLLCLWSVTAQYFTRWWTRLTPYENVSLYRCVSY